MAKHGKTKKKIITLIRSGKNNMSTISEELKLAPSTVSKHLQDLEDSGMIIQKDDSHIKKWKYYEVNEHNLKRERDEQSEPRRRFGEYGMAMAATAIAMVLVIAGLYMYGAMGGSTHSTYVPISITDPPQVPQGTQSLYINYSSLKVMISNGSGSKWIPINTSGRLDLIGLINASEVIGGVAVPAGSIITEVAFSIDSASITIDNVSYPVSLQSNMIVTSLASVKLNSSSGLLLDFSPAVVLLPDGNSTSFLMIPSIRAAMVGGMDHQPNQEYFGGPQPLPPRLSGPFETQNVTAYGASISATSNGNVSIEVTVRNSGSNPVRIFAIMVMPKYLPDQPMMGQQEQVMVRQQPQANSTNGTYPVFMPRNGENQQAFYIEENSALTINSSAVYQAWHQSGNDSVYIRLQQPTNSIEISHLGSAFGMDTEYQKLSFAAGTLNLMAEQNGTLTAAPDVESGRMQIGYNLTAGSTEHFSYSGQIIWPQQAVLLNSTGYSLIIITNRGIVKVNSTS